MLLDELVKDLKDVEIAIRGLENAYIERTQ